MKPEKKNKFNNDKKEDLSVKVAIRIRPLLTEELILGNSSLSVKCQKNSNKVNTDINLICDVRLDYHGRE